MKMNSHQRNNNFLVRGSTNRNIFLPIVAVIFLIGIFSLPFVKNILFKIGTPLWTVKNSISSFFSDNIGILSSKVSLLNENRLLKEQIGSRQKEQALFDLLKKENEDLKNVLERNTSKKNLLLGAVLVKPFLSAYDTLIIDVGSSDGVGLGNHVLADGNIFIGYISEVYNHTSKVVLYSSPGEKVNVLIGNNNIEKEAVGLGGGNFKIEMPREIDVKEGDSIIIPSISTNIFGVVEKIEFKETDSFENVIFKNPINIAELKWVEILLSN